MYQVSSIKQSRHVGRLTMCLQCQSFACSPLLQQGAAAAFEDVITLTRMLSKHPIDEALAQYQSARKPRVDWLIQASDGPLAFMAKLNKWFGDWIGATFQNLLFKVKGPLNVAGWRILLATDPIQDIKLDAVKLPSQTFGEEDEAFKNETSTIKPSLLKQTENSPNRKMRI